MPIEAQSSEGLYSHVELTYRTPYSLIIFNLRIAIYFLPMVFGNYRRFYGTITREQRDNAFEHQILDLFLEVFFLKPI